MEARKVKRHNYNVIRIGTILLYQAGRHIMKNIQYHFSTISIRDLFKKKRTNKRNKKNLKHINLVTK